MELTRILPHPPHPTPSPLLPVVERKIAEEHGQALGEPVAVGAGGAMHKPVDALFPALVGLLGAPELEIKAQAFAGIHEMMERLVVPGGKVSVRGPLPFSLPHLERASGC